MNACNRLRQVRVAPLTGLVQQRWSSTVDGVVSAAQRRRSELFTLEQRRQRERIGRVEKIEIRYQGLPGDTTLLMNKGLSTPFNCAQHLSERHCTQSALALLNGSTPWDLHRPLDESCTLQLLNFHTDDPHLVNRAFWRTCSFLLGAVLHSCIKDVAALQLHSFPGPTVKSGSFVHDIGLALADWRPTRDELRAISAGMVKLAAQQRRIERLQVSAELAAEMFRDNAFKRDQLPSIAKSGPVIVYRVGEHVDISRGPMIGHSGLLGKCTVSAVHRLGSSADQPNSTLYRVQGVALPSGFTLNHVAYGILEQRSRQLNPARLPNEPFDEQLVEGAIA